MKASVLALVVLAELRPALAASHTKVVIDGCQAGGGCTYAPTAEVILGDKSDHSASIDHRRRRARATARITLAEDVEQVKRDLTNARFRATGQRPEGELRISRLVCKAGVDRSCSQVHVEGGDQEMIAIDKEGQVQLGRASPVVTPGALRSIFGDTAAQSTDMYTRQDASPPVQIDGDAAPRAIRVTADGVQMRQAKYYRGVQLERRTYEFAKEVQSFTENPNGFGMVMGADGLPLISNYIFDMALTHCSEPTCRLYHKHKMKRWHPDDNREGANMALSVGPDAMPFGVFAHDQVHFSRACGAPQNNNAPNNFVGVAGDPTMCEINPTNASASNFCKVNGQAKLDHDAGLPALVPVGIVLRFLHCLDTRCMMSEQNVIAQTSGHILHMVQRDPVTGDHLQHDDAMTLQKVHVRTGVVGDLPFVLYVDPGCASRALNGEGANDVCSLNYPFKNILPTFRAVACANRNCTQRRTSVVLGDVNITTAQGDRMEPKLYTPGSTGPRGSWLLNAGSFGVSDRPLDFTTDDEGMPLLVWHDFARDSFGDIKKKSLFFARCNVTAAAIAAAGGVGAACASRNWAVSRVEIELPSPDLCSNVNFSSYVSRAAQMRRSGQPYDNAPPCDETKNWRSSNLRNGGAMALEMHIGSDGLPVVLFSTRGEVTNQPAEVDYQTRGARQMMLAHCEDHFCKHVTFSRVHHNTRGFGSFDIGTDGLPVVGAYHHASLFGIDEPGAPVVFAVHHCADVRCSVVDKTTVIHRLKMEFLVRNAYETKLRIGENGFPTIVMKDGNPFECARPEGCGPATASLGAQAHITTDNLARQELGYSSGLKKGVSNAGGRNILVIRCIDAACAVARSRRRANYDWERPEYGYGDVNGDHRGTWSPPDRRASSLRP